MKYMIFKDVVTVQGHGAVLLLQVGSTVLCLGDSGRSNKGAILEVRLFAPMAKKWLAIKRRRLTQLAPDAGESAPLQALSTPEHSATSQNLSTPTQRG